MSLDVSLELDGNRVFSSNITHNLGNMAAHAGIYYACWRPEEINATHAKHILPMLKSGIECMKAHPEHYEKFNAPNGWGLYKNFLPWVEEYAKACEAFPEATVSADR